MTDNNENLTSVTQSEGGTISDLDKKKVKKSKDDSLGIEVLGYPNRTLPQLIEELLEKNIPVHLSKDGYYVGGFYGLNQDNNLHKGFAFAQDTTDASALVFYDHKGNKHLVKSFIDLVKFNGHVWAAFFKISDNFKKPDEMWFGYLLEHGALTIIPGK